MALAVNCTYCEENGTARDIREAWRSVDSFSRESSRASAGFIPALLRMAEITCAQTVQKSFLQIPRTLAYYDLLTP